MRQSELINELCSALSKAQGEIEHAEKSSVNPHFKSRYADLASVIDALKKPLSKNGLSYVQVSAVRENGHWVLTTRLMHSSGQWIEGDVPVIASKADAQGFGSGLTYARRYGLAAICGVAQDDDDGNQASASPQQKPESKRAVVTKNTPQASGSIPPMELRNDAPISAAQQRELIELAASKKITSTLILTYMHKHFNAAASSHLTVSEWKDFCAKIRENQIDWSTYV
jgi:hypothetical protein